MKKLSLVIIIALIIVLAVFIIIRKSRTSATAELEELLSQNEQASQDADQAIDELSAIDEEEDSLDKLSEMLMQEPPVSFPSPTPFLPAAPTSIDTTDLDALLNAVDQADSNAGKAINDLQNIDESEDNIPF